MSGHTKGPWGYEDPMGPDILTIVANPEAPVYDWIWVAQIGTEPVGDDDGTVRDNRSFEEHEANARLVAAAPDLLEALKDIAAWAEQANPAGYGGLSEALLKKALAAIARAEGHRP